MTPLGLMTMTTLPQGATNSVAQFVRFALKVLGDYSRDQAQPFLDDVVLRDLKLRTMAKSLLQESGAMLLSIYKT